MSGKHFFNFQMQQREISALESVCGGLTLGLARASGGWNLAPPQTRPQIALRGNPLLRVICCRKSPGPSRPRTEKTPSEGRRSSHRETWETNIYVTFEILISSLIKIVPPWRWKQHVPPKFRNCIDYTWCRTYMQWIVLEAQFISSEAPGNDVLGTIHILKT